MKNSTLCISSYFAFHFLVIHLWRKQDNIPFSETILCILGDRLDSNSLIVAMYDLGNPTVTLGGMFED